MSNSLIWFVVALLAGLLLVFVVFKRGKAKTNYKNLFNMGLMFMALGVFQLYRDGGSIFFILGVIYAAVGYSKRSEWKKKSKPPSSK